MTIRRCGLAACILLGCWSTLQAASAASLDLPDAATACALPAGMQWSFDPVSELKGAESYGSDRAAEPFVLAMMQADAAWRGSADQSIARSAIAALAAWADAGALETVVEVGKDQSNTNSIYSLRRALIPLLVTWSDLGSAASEADRDKIGKWLNRLETLQDTDTGGLKGRGGSGAISNRNNHSYMRATVDALWATAANDKARAAQAAAIAGTALSGMRPDGSLPLETARGARALWYQRHALASLVFTAELLRPFGYDLWEPRGDGHSLHDAVGFLIAASENPDLVAAYAATDRNPKPGTDPKVQDLGFMEPRGHGRHYMAWVELYLARFPNHENTPKLRQLVHPSLDGARPLLDELAGGNTSCRIATSHAKAAGQ